MTRANVLKPLMLDRCVFPTSFGCGGRPRRGESPDGARGGFTVDAMSTGELLCGRYALRGVLGRGGMAEVRDGWDNRLGRAVAVKLLHPGLVADAESRRRLILPIGVSVHSRTRQ
jgi:serine/threonine protein kinase